MSREWSLFGESCVNAVITLLFFQFECYAYSTSAYSGIKFIRTFKWVELAACVDVIGNSTRLVLLLMTWLAPRAGGKPHLFLLRLLMTMCKKVKSNVESFMTLRPTLRFCKVTSMLSIEAITVLISATLSSKQPRIHMGRSAVHLRGLSSAKRVAFRDDLGTTLDTKYRGKPPAQERRVDSPRVAVGFRNWTVQLGLSPSLMSLLVLTSMSWIFRLVRSVSLLPRLLPYPKPTPRHLLYMPPLILLAKARRESAKLGGQLSPRSKLKS